MKNHKHKLVAESMSGKSVGFHCKVKGCDFRTSRETTPQEKKRIDRYFKDETFRAKHSLHAQFKDFLDKKAEKCDTDLIGADFMDVCDAFVDKHPDAMVTNIDDSHFSTSCILFLPHRDKNGLWGTTCYLVPQFGGTPTQFFLYEGHRRALIDALKKLNPTNKQYKRDGGLFDCLDRKIVPRATDNIAPERERGLKPRQEETPPKSRKGKKGKQ